MFIEGRWPYAIDEKDRLPIPPELRENFGERAIVAIEPPDGPVVIFTVKSWKRKRKAVLKEAGNLQQFTLTWKPATVKLDAQGRIILPDDQRNLLEQRVIEVSIAEDEYLKVINDGDKQDESSLSGNPGGQTSLRKFRDFWEAKEYRDKDKKVVYFSPGGGKVTGKFDPKGGFFTFTGKNEKVIRFSIVASWDKFYPGE